MYTCGALLPPAPALLILVNILSHLSLFHQWFSVSFWETFCFVGFVSWNRSKPLRAFYTFLCSKPPNNDEKAYYNETFCSLLKLHRSCIGTLTALYWNCIEALMNFYWSCIEAASKFHWNCQPFCLCLLISGSAPRPVPLSTPLLWSTEQLFTATLYKTDCGEISNAQSTSISRLTQISGKTALFSTKATPETALFSPQFLASRIAVKFPIFLANPLMIFQFRRRLLSSLAQDPGPGLASDPDPSPVLDPLFRIGSMLSHIYKLHWQKAPLIALFLSILSEWTKNRFLPRNQVLSSLELSMPFTYLKLHWHNDIY